MTYIYMSFTLWLDNFFLLVFLQWKFPQMFFISKHINLENFMQIDQILLESWTWHQNILLGLGYKTFSKQLGQWFSTDGPYIPERFLGVHDEDESIQYYFKNISEISIGRKTENFKKRSCKYFPKKLVPHSKNEVVVSNNQLDSSWNWSPWWTQLISVAYSEMNTSETNQSFYFLAMHFSYNALHLRITKKTSSTQNPTKHTQCIFLNSLASARIRGSTNIL